MPMFNIQAPSLLLPAIIARLSKVRVDLKNVEANSISLKLYPFITQPLPVSTSGQLLVVES